MGDDPGTAIQHQNLIGDDVAEEINSAMGEQMNGSVTPPTVVQPTEHRVLPPEDTRGNVATNDEPATDAKPQPQPLHDEPSADPAPAASAVQDDTADSNSDEPPAVTALPQPQVTPGSGNFSELQDIKTQALQDLGPLVQHIDQDPEERFNTLIMMIRASDDASLVQPAFDAAQAIEDDKKRAQALLDVVNEVNYLTRPQENQD